MPKVIQLADHRAQIQTREAYFRIQVLNTVFTILWESYYIYLNIMLGNVFLKGNAMPSRILKVNSQIDKKEITELHLLRS